MSNHTRELVTRTFLAVAIARAASDYHEGHGDVLWWRFPADEPLPVDEPPYLGTPDSSDWPGYHTHWTPIIVPEKDEGVMRDD